MAHSPSRQCKLLIFHVRLLSAPHSDTSVYQRCCCSLQIGQLKELMPLVSKFLSNKAARASTVKETEEAASSLSDTAAV